MYLYIDVGNTRIKWQYRDDKSLLNAGSLTSHRSPAI